MSPQPDDLYSNQVIGLAIRVHRALGPGLLESAYEECLAYELTRSGLPFGRQVGLPVVYEEVRLDCGYRIDFVIDNQLLIELKSVDRLMPIHDAQILTYLRLSGCRIGLLMNFNQVVLREGLRRFVL
ncbi:MAG TPA: GxxExxY protein [Magnetospirillaceae bacterium]|nr:GxxExxY protein [Magnetospirillaceae bacterium]